MSKRFEINNNMNLDDKVETYELSCIVDNSNKTFYFVVDSIANVESFVERLNELHEENQSSKEFIEQLQEELVLFKKAGANMGIDLNAQITALKQENEQLKKDNEWLLQCVKNQSVIIQELDSVIMAYNMEHKIIIKLTEKDLRTLDKASSYYTHQKVELDD